MKHRETTDETRYTLQKTTSADAAESTTDQQELVQVAAESRRTLAPRTAAPPRFGPTAAAKKVVSIRGRVWLAGLGALAVAATSLGCHVAPIRGDGVGNATLATTSGPSVTPVASASIPTAGVGNDDPNSGPGHAPAASSSTYAGPPQVAATVRSAAVAAVAPGGATVPGGVTVPGGGPLSGGWTSGVAAGTLAEANQWAAFRGRPVDVIVTFADRSSWETITHPWLGSDPEKFAGFAGTWVISQPFFPDSGGDIGACASGAYNSHWQEFGRWLIGQGRANSIVRLAWEFNGDWFPWSASNKPGSWVGCFQQVVGAIRQTDAQARIDWTLNSHTDGAFDFYPGDAYVDVIGIDTFDMWPASTDENSWNTQCDEAEGLCSVIKFARAHGKKFSVPEWGLVGTHDTGAGRAGQSGGDNPFYIRKMHDTFVANADVVSYEAYFSNSDPGNVHSSLTGPVEEPSSAQAYASLW